MAQAAPTPTTNVVPLRPRPQFVHPPRELPTRTPEMALIVSLIDALDSRGRKKFKGMTVLQVMQHSLRTAERSMPEDRSVSSAIAFIDKLRDAGFA